MSEAPSMISGTLIASDKVKSTDVYSLVGDELGSDDRQGQRSRDLCGDVVRRFLSRHGREVPSAAV